MIVKGHPRERGKMWICAQERNDVITDQKNQGILVYGYIPPFPFPDDGGKRDIDEERSFVKTKVGM